MSSIDKYQRIDMAIKQNYMTPSVSLTHSHTPTRTTTPHTVSTTTTTTTKPGLIYIAFLKKKKHEKNGVNANQWIRGGSMHHACAL